MRQGWFPTTKPHYRRCACGAPRAVLRVDAGNLHHTTNNTTDTAATTTMGDLTQEHCRARNAGAAQAIVAVALCIFWLDAGALTALLVLFFLIA